jgi:hypothetical protein
MSARYVMTQNYKRVQNKLGWNTLHKLSHIQARDKLLQVQFLVYIEPSGSCHLTLVFSTSFVSQERASRLVGFMFSSHALHFTLNKSYNYFEDLKSLSTAIKSNKKPTSKYDHSCTPLLHSVITRFCLDSTQQLFRNSFSFSVIIVFEDMVPKDLWQRATPVILDSFAGRAWKYKKCYT